MTWRDQLVEWVPEIRSPLDVNVILSSKDLLHHGYRANVISYNLIEKMKGDIIRMSPRIIIVDESHYIKTLDTSRTKALVPIIKQATHALLLTGTPALSRPAELYSQLDALGVPIFDTFKQFAFRFV